MNNSILALEASGVDVAYNGDPTKVEEAEKWGADLIVVGTRERRGLRRFISGSVSETVARRAPCASVRAWRRMRSMARLRAVVTIHPAGLGGTPSTGQRSSATTTSLRRRRSQASARFATTFN